MSNDPEQFQSGQAAPGWAELQTQLDALRGRLERMLEESADTGYVYGQFHGMASAIVERAPPDLVESVNSELGAMLRDLKLSGDSED